MTKKELVNALEQQGKCKVCSKPITQNQRYMIASLGLDWLCIECFWVKLPWEQCESKEAVKAKKRRMAEAAV